MIIESGGASRQRSGVASADDRIGGRDGLGTGSRRTFVGETLAIAKHSLESADPMLARGGMRVAWLLVDVESRRLEQVCVVGGHDER